MTARDDEITALREQVEALALEVRRLRPRESAHIPPGVTVGENVKLDPSVTLWGSEEKPISIGDKTNIYRNAEINGPVSIGEGCLINRDGYIRGNTTIGERVFIGPFVRIVTDSHEIGDSSRRAGANRSPAIAIGDGTWIGAGVTVLGGVTIGKGCVVAAGAVVVHDVEDNTLVAGVPARPIRRLP